MNLILFHNYKTKHHLDSRMTIRSNPIRAPFLIMKNRTMAQCLRNQHLHHHHPLPRTLPAQTQLPKMTKLGRPTHQRVKTMFQIIRPTPHLLLLNLHNNHHHHLHHHHHHHPRPVNLLVPGQVPRESPYPPQDTKTHN